MGIDHGLGGKDTAKNKLKRASKAHKIKMLTLADISSENKRKSEVVFDEDARQKWLTGFRKRKLTRRKYGLAMEELKVKKARQQVKKEIRTSSNVNTEYNEMEDEDDEGRETNNEAEEGTEIKFADESTNAMFGGDVSVVIGEGIAEELDNFHNPDLEELKTQRGQSRTKREPSNLEKALKSAGEKMQKKYFKQGGKKRFKKKDGTKLLHKALGSGALGKNTFKGSKKKR